MSFEPASMIRDYQRLVMEYRASPDQQSPNPVSHTVVVVGAGPIGLATAIDLAQKGAAWQGMAANCEHTSPAACSIK